MAAINSLGAVVDLQAVEEVEQTTDVVRVLPFDSRTHLVLRGPYKGRQLKYAREREVSRLLMTYAHVRCSKTQIRPWWRCWRRTSALVLQPAYPDEAGLF